MDALSDPRNQTFFILGGPNANGSGSGSGSGDSNSGSPHLIAISLPVIDAQRVRLASTSINYGVQLGLCLLSLLTSLLLLPTAKLRRPVHLTQVLCLAVSVTRLALLVLYFPGPLTEYYVAWTRDASVLPPAAYNVTTASSALSVLQLALVEASLMLQSRVLVRTWGARYTPSCLPSPPTPTAANTTTSSVTTYAYAHANATSLPANPAAASTARVGQYSWRPPVLLLAVLLAGSAVALRAVWVAHYTQALRGHTLPVPLDGVGQAAAVVGAASVFYFCGVFFAHLALHLAATRRVLRGSRRRGSGRRRKFSVALTLGRGGRGRGGRRTTRGLTSLEILAVGNGILMLAPCLFAGLDVAAGPGNTRVLPFDAGSWVQTLVAAGLPLISVAAVYRGSDSAESRMRQLSYRERSDRRTTRRASSPFFFTSNNVMPSFSTRSLFGRQSRAPSKSQEDVATLGSTMDWDPRTPVDSRDLDDLEAGDVRASPTNSRESGREENERRATHSRPDGQVDVQNVRPS